MKVVKTITTAGLLCFALGVTAQTIIRPENQGKSPTFAIFTDEQTWQHCREELEAYRDVLGEEDLPTYIIYNDWQRPEEVKDIIRRLHRRNRLEGAVFVGDIPIPMIRKAQHLTSAFKMDETVDRRESSVPSDRFYDDLHLEFEPLGQDSLNPQFFYYNLDVHSPQHIRCDIYTGRIKPVADGTDRYEQISRYLRKAIHYVIIHAGRKPEHEQEKPHHIFYGATATMHSFHLPQQETCNSGNQHYGYRNEHLPLYS